MFTSTMRHLTAVVLRRDSEVVSRELLNVGLLDFVRIEEFLPEGASSFERGPQAEKGGENSASRLRDDRLRIENLTSSMPGVSLKTAPLSLETVPDLDIDEIENGLNHLAAGLQEIRNRQRELNQELMKLDDLRHHFDLPGEGPDRGGIEMLARREDSFISVRTGSIVPGFRVQARERIHRFPSVLMDLPEREGRLPLMIISLRRDSREILSILEEYGWREEKLPEAGGQKHHVEALKELESRKEALRKQQQAAADEYKGMLEDKLSFLQEQWASLAVHEKLIQIRSNFSHTERTVLFTGWVPADKTSPLEAVIRKASNSRCWIEWHEAGEVRTSTGGKVPAPVELHNPGFLKPFEMLVENYAIPEYGSVDPTPFVAVAFLSMFGLMFADAGQGLVLVLIGLLGPRLIPGIAGKMRRLFTLIAYCGAAAVVSGTLFGSWFGRPWLPPLWFNYHALVSGHSSGNPAVRSVYDILFITIVFGIAVLATGLLLNWINLLKKRDWFSLSFEKGGILGAWIYAWGIYAAFYFAGSGYRELPSDTVLLAGFGIPALLLFFKHPIHLLRHRTKGSTLGFTAIMTFLMEWIVELLEIFSGYLANTLSFMRVAGLGIAHVSLMTAFDQIASMTSPSGSFSFWSLLILLTGNILVIALEGLSAGIQSLRLNYYEFFSKYFTGSGRAYAPISLRSSM
ncbi:V-type ATPase 116kDa subunit family protein [Marispirochaeta aestuarii]|uniref:V-type ATP synthase subunit I n=1 Tax=Marispirochaeta aestuarii TaxID=1963862 RepID=UPI0029C78357|nr:V-type ATPase 116kDa subunit family protein [Marispirochaeta aestuarii]